MNRFVGKWKITEMEQWDKEYIDLIEPGYFRFDNNNQGQFVFGTVSGFMDCRYDKNKSPRKVEFSWEGTSEYDSVSGRGWFELNNENSISGMLFIHNGDQSWVKAVRE